MKRLLFIVSIILLSCGDKEDETDQGCQTGILKNGGTTREFIRCCTKQQALAGDNVGAGGVARASNYKSITWEKCSQCK